MICLARVGLVCKVSLFKVQKHIKNARSLKELSVDQSRKPEFGGTGHANLGYRTEPLNRNRLSRKRVIFGDASSIRM